MKNIKEITELEMLETIAIDSVNTQVESFYRLESETAHKYTQSQQTIELIKRLAAQKKKFYEYYKENISSENTTVVPFFTRLLNSSEIVTQKDLMDYSLEEVKEAVVRIAKDEKLSSKSIYGSWLSVMHHYFRWGYQQDPKLKTFIISSLDLPHYTEVMDSKEVAQKVLTWKEMQMLIQNVENVMADCALSLTTDGLKLEEILKIKREDIQNSLAGELILDDRAVRLSSNVYEKALQVSMLQTMPRLLSNGNIKEIKLSESPYLIRSYARKDFNLDIPQTKSVVSNMISSELGKAGYNGTLKDFRASSIANDIYNWHKDIKIEKDEVYPYANRKYGLNMIDSSTIGIRYKAQLDVLTERYRGK